VANIPDNLIYREILHATDGLIISELLTLRLNQQLHLVFLQLLPIQTNPKDNNARLLPPPNIIGRAAFETIFLEFTSNLVELAKAQHCQQIITKLYNPLLIKMFTKAGFVLIDDDSSSEIISYVCMTRSV